MTGRPHRIAVVEDDPVDWIMIRDAFESQFETIELDLYVDGVTLLEALEDESNHPDLILLDLNLPRLSGLDTLDRIRREPTTQHLTVIIMTTSDAESDILRGYDSGANSYVVKPQTFDDLATSVHSIGSYWTETVYIPGKTE